MSDISIIENLFMSRLKPALITQLTNEHYYVTHTTIDLRTEQRTTYIPPLKLLKTEYTHHGMSLIIPPATNLPKYANDIIANHPAKYLYDITDKVNQISEATVEYELFDLKHILEIMKGDK